MKFDENFCFNQFSMGLMWMRKHGDFVDDIVIAAHSGIVQDTNTSIKYSTCEFVQSFEKSNALRLELWHVQPLHA